MFVGMMLTQSLWIDGVSLTGAVTVGAVFGVSHVLAYLIRKDD